MILETADTMVSQELIDHTRQELGLDKPFLVQYGNWLSHAVQGDLGMSYSAKKPVVDKMMEALPGTLMLASVTMCSATRHSRSHGGYRRYLPE